MLRKLHKIGEIFVIKQQEIAKETFILNSTDKKPKYNKRNFFKMCD